MFGSEALDVGIGLVLVFLLVSIVLTAVQEGIEAVLQTRASYLQQPIGELMQGDDQALQALYEHPLVFALYRGDPPHTVGLRPRSSNLPAYIPREVFSAALIDMIKSGERLPDRLQDAYDGLDRLTGGDAGWLRREIEGWYDSTMDRASGWFKKRTQRSLFFLGLGAALMLNINAVTIAQYLNANDTQRLLVVGAAESIAQRTDSKPNIAPLSQADANKLHLQLQQIGLPIGWSPSTRAWMWPWRYDAGASGWTILAPIPTILLLIAGWLITALAAMLGAPFWFDVLNRLMVIRSTVKPKEKSLDEPSEDGGEARNPSDNGAIYEAGTATWAGRPSGGLPGPERDRAVSSAQPIYG